MNIQDLNFTAWHDKDQDCWKAKAEQSRSTVTFATGSGDSANEAVEDCVISASIRLSKMQ